MVKKLLSMALSFALLLTCFSGIALIGVTAEELPEPYMWFDTEGGNVTGNCTAITNTATNTAATPVEIPEVGGYGFKLNNASYWNRLDITFDASGLPTDGRSVTLVMEYYINSTFTANDDWAVMGFDNGNGNAPQSANLFTASFENKKPSLFFYTYSAADIETIRQKDAAKIRLLPDTVAMQGMYIKSMRLVDTAYVYTETDPGYEYYDFENPTKLCDYYEEYTTLNAYKMSYVDGEITATFPGYRYFKVEGASYNADKTQNKPVYIKVYTTKGNENTTVGIQAFEVSNGTTVGFSNLLGYGGASIKVKNGVGGVLLRRACFNNTLNFFTSFRFNLDGTAQKIARIEVYDVNTYCSGTNATAEMKEELHAAMVKNKSNVVEIKAVEPTATQSGLTAGYDCALCGANIVAQQVIPALGDNVPPAMLPTIFSNGMMFQQNKPMNVFGYGVAGTQMTAELYKGEEKLETVTATVDETGRFDLAFSARKGSYDAYSFRVYGGGLDKTVKNVLIGELWVAGGQSNMELAVRVCEQESEVIVESDKNLRVFCMPTIPSEDVLLDPAKDIPKAYWINGNKLEISSVSSVGLAFAAKLKRELNVPVGFLNTAIGGTVIEAWISRDAISNNAALKAELDKRALYYDEEYIPLSNGLMSTYYNQKIGPLAGFNVAGTIWYQGESNSNRSEIYDVELALLKQSWGETFGYENGGMPFIFTQVAPYRYDNGLYNQQHLGYLAMYMERGWKLCDTDTTAMLTIYDLPLNHMMEDGKTSTNPIHPRVKTPVGERFAAAALNMVYGGTGEYTAPVYKSMEIKGGAIYITFDRVGSGLKSVDGTANLHGFTIAGADGVYVNAEAVIVDADTVKVWNTRVNDPKNVIYAFDNFNQGANLANSANIPASPFRTVQLNDTTSKPDASVDYFTAQDWMLADKDVWVYDSTFSEVAAFRPSFTVTGGTYGYNNTLQKEGTGALQVDFGGNFTVSPILTYESVKQSYAKYNTLSVWVRNVGATAVELTLTVNGNTAVKTVDGAAAVTLAAGTKAYHLVTFDLSAVDATSFTFGGTAAAAGTLLFDEFSFGMTEPFASGSCLHTAVVLASGKDATCTEPGLTAGSYCDLCGESVVVQEVVEAPGHSWDDGAVTKEPTTMKPGVFTYTCTVCGETKTEEIKPKAQLGDVDGNGRINSTDARLVLQKAVGKISDEALNIAVADVNKDNKINSSDARLILQFSVGKITTFPVA